MTIRALSQPLVSRQRALVSRQKAIERQKEPMGDASPLISRWVSFNQTKSRSFAAG
jgi:hypothetical protein